MKSFIYFLIVFISGISWCMIFSFTVSCANDHLTDLAKKSNVTSDTTATTQNKSSTTPSTTSSSTSGSTSGPASVSGAVSFITDIRPILIKYQCASCHGGYYVSYEGASSLAKSGQLYGTMSGAQGYRRMPPDSKANSTELALISNWIKQGALNN